MFEQIQDTVLKATETTAQFQQEMIRFWSQPWVQAPEGPAAAAPAPAAGLTEQVRALPKLCAPSVTEALHKHRAALDARYRFGIGILENTLRVGQARDPGQFCKLTEDLCRHGAEGIKTLAEARMRDVQAALTKGFEVASRGLAAGRT